MTSPLLLDTHAWIWLIEGDSRLPRKLLPQLESAAAENRLLLAAISLWEAALLEAKGRIRLHPDCLEWLHRALRLSRVRLVPLSPEIAAASARLPGDFHGDPADRLIVASARHANAMLVTVDERILRYAKAGHVKAGRA